MLQPLHYSYLPSELRVTVAQLSLINDDPEEKVYAIFRVVLFDGYDYTSGLHDIALLQVYNDKNCNVSLTTFFAIVVDRFTHRVQHQRQFHSL